MLEQSLMHTLRKDVQMLWRVGGVRQFSVIHTDNRLYSGYRVFHGAPMVMLYCGKKRVTLPVYLGRDLCWLLIEDMLLTIYELQFFEDLWEKMPRYEGQPKELPDPAFFAKLQLKLVDRLN